jgi:16S rRNA G966 N2-methylase RsmD
MTETMIAKIINKKNALKSLSDAEFERILPLLAEELETHGILYETYTDEELSKDWKLLCGKPTTTNISATSVAGMKVLRKHMRHFHEVANHKGHSVRSLWKRENLEKALRFNRANHSTPYASEIIRSLSFTNGLGKVTMYRPLMARNVVAHFGAKTVLDVCAGWGGRMIGAKSVDLDGVQYTGIEPNTKTYAGLCAIRDELGLSGVNLICEPAEKALLEFPADAKFDLALTSPPYYNLEIYSGESTQSVGERDYASWINSFLKPVILGVIARVTYSCWSVKNFKTDRQYDLLDDVVRIHKEAGWKQIDTVFTMSNSKRPGGGGNNEAPKKTEEITYVFIKE